MAIMGNASYLAALSEMREAEAAARTFGIETDTAELRRAEDILPAFDAFKSKVQALYVCGDALVNAYFVRINTLALGARLPTMSPPRSRSAVPAIRRALACAPALRRTAARGLSPSQYLVD
jgi:hypothetical protein